MPGVYPRYKQEAPSYPLNSGVSVTGGQLVSADTSVTGVAAVKPSGATDTTVLGVALTDALGTPNPETGVINAAYLPSVTAVENQCIITVSYATAATFGQPLYPAANGQVTVTSGTVPSIGQCRQASVAAGSVGFALINVV